jgi:hypothetical protein
LLINQIEIIDMAKLNTEQLCIETSLITNSMVVPLMPLNPAVGKKWLNEMYNHIKDVWVDELGSQPKPSELEDELLEVLIYARSIQPSGFSEVKIDARMVEIVNIYPRLKKALFRADKRFKDPKMLFAHITDTNYVAQVKRLAKAIDQE